MNRDDDDDDDRDEGVRGGRGRRHEDDDDDPEEGGSRRSGGYDRDRGEFDEPDNPRHLRAREKTSIPGVLLIACGILNIVAALVCLGITIKNATMSRAEFDEAQRISKQMMPGIQLPTYEEQKQQAVLIYGSSTVFSLLAGILPIIGGIKMRNLRSYGLCIASAVIAAIPCLSASSCAVIGLVAGIWAVIVLMDGEVKAAFR